LVRIFWRLEAGKLRIELSPVGVGASNNGMQPAAFGRG
jgi:hypothetical protein